MTGYISLSQAFAQWQELAADIDKDDGPALAESWNDYTDSLCKDGELCSLQYHYAPAWDESMPGEGSRWDALSDDREFILDAMGVTMEARFVPFSQSRNKGEKEPSLNWVVVLKKDGREFIATDYMQGNGHAPSYHKVFNSPALNPGTEKRRAIAEECEKGTVYAGGWRVGKKIEAPKITDVFHSLLLDGGAIDCRDFADWCGDLGFDTDSRKAKDTYDACVQTGLTLRGTFGDSTMRDLRDLFEGM